MTVERSRATLLVVLGSCYAAVSLGVTWPLATQMTTALGTNNGDPAFVAFVLTWVDRHLTAVFRGDLGAWAAMWNAPIFAPEPAALTYSEHFLAQAVQSLPVYWLSGNPLLAYNLQFLATLVLTALAAHVLAWRMTGSHMAGAVAGLAYSFSYYRMYWSAGHLHTMSIQWWVFALVAIDRYAERGTRRALVSTALSLTLLHFSSNYLMAFTAPFTVAFSLWALARHGRLTDPRAWGGLALAGAASVAVVVPIVVRYLATREALAFSRTLDELIGNSVSWTSYRLAAPWLAPIVALGALGVVVGALPSGLTRRARVGLLALALIAFVLAMGPQIPLGDSTIAGPYGLLYQYVPGFNGLRVPHRFVAIGLLFLSLLAGAASVWLTRRWVGAAVVATLLAATTRYAWAEPFPIAQVIESPGLNLAPAYLAPSFEAPMVYRFARTLPRDAVLIELPFGDLAYDILYTYFTTAHDRRIVNGYSGVLPQSYLDRRAVLATPLRDPDASWRALSPATHVVVHTAAWPDDTGRHVREWLEARGATPMGDGTNGAWIYALPGR